MISSRQHLFHLLVIFFVLLTLSRAAGVHARNGTIRLEENMVINSGPGGRSFQKVTSVAYDRSGSAIAIVDAGASRVYISDRHGEFTSVLGRREELSYPVGVAVDGKGSIYISERNSASIKVFEGEPGRLSGKYVEMRLPVESGIAVSPGRISIGPDGAIYLVDEKNGWIYVFDPERNFQYRMGRDGKGSKAFKLIADVACDPRGIVYSAGRGLSPLNEFDRTGQFVQPVYDPTGEIEEIIDPVAVAADSRNRLWVLDGTRETLSIYGPAGDLIQTIEEEDIPGGLFLPVDIEFDGFGNLILLEQGAGRLRLFSPKY